MMRARLSMMTRARIPMSGMVVAAILATCWGASDVRAQPEGLSDEDRARAVRHYERGAAYFKEKEYRLALAEYQRAYDISRAPLMLFNIGLVHRATGAHEAAVQSFEEFLRLEPESTVSEEARGYLREARAALEREREENARQASDPDASGVPGIDDTGPDTTEGSRPGRALRLSGIGLAAGGAAALVTGAIFGVRANSIEAEFNEHEGPWTDAQLDRIGAGERAERTAIVALSVGGVLLLAGGVTYWLGTRAASRPSSASASGTSSDARRPGRAEQTFTIAPTFSQDGASLFISGRF